MDCNIPAGYTVTWLSEQQCALVENDEFALHITIGEDSYIRSSKTAQGMTAPQSFGAKPVVLGGGYSFVPAKLFNLLFCEVTEQDGAVALTSASTVQIPNPMQACGVPVYTRSETSSIFSQ